MTGISVQNAPFTDVFERVKRPTFLEDAVEYPCLGVRWYGLGAYIRETKLGGTIARKEQWRVKENDVLYNKLFAWRGAFAVADKIADECIASDKFPTYRFDCSRVNPDYLRLWFRSPQLADQAQALSKGAAALSKLTLNPPDFWKLTIPLPPLQQQTEIAQTVMAMLTSIERIERARAPLDATIHGRRAGVGSQVRLVLDAALADLNSCFVSDLGILDEVLTMRPRSGPSFVVSEEGEGIPVIMPSATLGYRYDAAKCLYGLGGEAVSPKDILTPGDLLISRGNYRDQVGICIVYPGAAEERTYANLLMRMQVDRARVMPEFVKYWIMSPLCVHYIRKHTKGTSPSVQKINQRALVAMPFPRGAALNVQRTWVERLDRVFDEAEYLERKIREQYSAIQAFKDNLIRAAFDGRLEC
ncbi:restriction endonuclease subunit S [Jiella sp. MQZ9-1]|uniref:Restriction endonuclease subunit S n=1 Tax=Jiella flava TaxID=2816857 RepID=A0A939FZR3_9HYPH|nr:restriction endonuclease subunit S [Jiella flava]MBO0662507.1 restriction endonuclease subunit S [Jiella flava]MCD2471732.1 restriction endonuclease subunit S [Jiella flava]